MTANITAKLKAAMEQAYGQFNESSTSSWVPPTLSTSTTRHLETDATALLNFITLSQLSASLTDSAVAEAATQRAKLLIHNVHDTLGRTQDGTRRLDGASDDEPLKGGLRSGTLLDGEIVDGQSHSDLMLWTFALNRYSILTKDKTYNDLAIQLAQAIIPYFVTKKDDGSVKIHSKMSANLTDGPLDSENEDPLALYEGYTILTLVQRTDSSSASSSNLTSEIELYASLHTSAAADIPLADALSIARSLWITQFLKDSDDSIRALCQRSFTQLMALQRARYFSKESEERDVRSELKLACAIRCFDYSKSSAVFEGIADNVVLNWEYGITSGEDGGEDEGTKKNAGEKVRDLVLLAAALEPGAFKDGFLQ